MKLSVLKPGATSRVSTDIFQGYKHKLKIADGEMYETKNLTSDDFPMLATRTPRGVVGTLTSPGGMLEKNVLCYVDDGTLYVGGEATALTTISAGEKQLVSMGAYIVIFPDRLYYNTGDASDYGSIDASWSTEGATVTYDPCDIDGNVYTITTSADEPPANPDNGEYWYDTNDNVLQQYSTALGSWVKLESVYTKVTITGATDLSDNFKEGDGVDISGLAFDDLNGTKYLYGVGADYIVLIGLTGDHSSATADVSVRRTAPAMDFVIECQNRLWGCFYGVLDGQQVNEIYCSALGDFKNWRQYQGLSTDSWAASVGSDGPWTGAVNFRGYPTFFKENRVHSVTVSAAGAHRLEETVCRGVQSGCSKSLVVVGETLYYKSQFDVCAWQGGIPVTVSEALGDEAYSDAVAGAIGSKYYVSMMDSKHVPQLLVYDISRGLWMHEDRLRARYFASVGPELWCIDSDRRLLAMLGTDGTAEAFEWGMETGIMYYEYPDKKYVSRYDIRLQMSDGASMKIWLEYDSSGEWKESGEIKRKGIGSVVVPIRPRRCDHLRMKLTGSGAIKIFSITRVLEVGSDV